MKIYITGPVAAGKTTVSKKLSEKLGIPFYSVDDFIFGQDGTQIYYRDRTERETKTQEILVQRDWIVEGVLFPDVLPFLENADLVLGLDEGRRMTFVNICRRYFRQMTGMEEYTVHPSFALFITNLKSVRQYYKNRDIIRRFLAYQCGPVFQGFKTAENMIKFLTETNTDSSSDSFPKAIQ